MGKTFAQTETEHQRRIILEVLETDAGYSHNESILKTALKAVGHSISSDRLRTELYWLQEQGLVELDEVMGLTIASLTQRGIDVAVGDSQVPGITRKGL